jgi:hypothetical protein
MSERFQTGAGWEPKAGVLGDERGFIGEGIEGGEAGDDVDGGIGNGEGGRGRDEPVDLNGEAIAESLPEGDGV